MLESIILIGGSGHAKVIIDCVRASGSHVAGILDDGIAAGSSVHDVPVLGKVSDYPKYAQYLFLIAIGNNEVRCRIAQSMDVRWATVVHPSAVVSAYAGIGEGTVVMPGAVINSGAVIGSHCIVNTGAIIEHDNQIGDFAHISVGAKLAGTVSIGRKSWVGIGAVVSNNLSVCSDCMIGAGTVVIRSIAEPGTYVGNPARRIK